MKPKNALRWQKSKRKTVWAPVISGLTFLILITIVYFNSTFSLEIPMGMIQGFIIGAVVILILNMLATMQFVSLYEKMPRDKFIASCGCIGAGLIATIAVRFFGGFIGQMISGHILMLVIFAVGFVASVGVGIWVNKR